METLSPAAERILEAALRRIAVGGLSLDPSLPPGAARPLTPEELELIWAPSSPFPQA